MLVRHKHSCYTESNARKGGGPMELRVLRYFLTVAQAESISARRGAPRHPAHPLPPAQRPGRGAWQAAHDPRQPAHYPDRGRNAAAKAGRRDP